MSVAENFCCFLLLVVLAILAFLLFCTQTRVNVFARIGSLSGQPLMLATGSRANRAIYPSCMHGPSIKCLNLSHM